MYTAFLRNGRKTHHSVNTLLHRQSIADSVGAPVFRTRPPPPPHHQPSKEYARLPYSLFRKAKELHWPAPSLFSSPFSSSTAASTSKNWFVGWYMGMVKSHPILTKSVTSAGIYTAADLSSQTIAGKFAEPYDLVRTSRMAGYGMIILGPSLHYWFNFVSKVLPKRDLITTLKKIVMGQTLYGPVMTAVFFSVNAALQGENGAEIAARLKRDMIPTMINGVMYWPVCDFITFKFFPVHLQPLMSNSFSLLWTIYMTYMASLEKASPPPNDEPAAAKTASVASNHPHLA